MDHAFYRKSYPNLAVVARVQNDGNDCPHFILTLSAFLVIIPIFNPTSSNTSKEANSYVTCVEARILQSC